jgi:hypothetical protein
MKSSARRSMLSSPAGEDPLPEVDDDEADLE